MIQAALRLWHMEHGELPATLDALKGVYLTDVPLVPFYNKPFEYNPKPDAAADSVTIETAEMMASMSRWANHIPGTPYLATTLDDSFPTDYALVNNQQTFVYDLTFAK